MKIEVKCSSCGQSSSSPVDFKCDVCGQPLDIRLGSDFEKAKIIRNDYTVWRYAKFFPYIDKSQAVTLGEGWTPLVRFADNVWFKLENLNPTGSFKDRGSSILISAVNRLIGDAGGYLSEDSSGNAGASIAAYAARANLKARIYVPDMVSGPKFNQIQFYGADVVKVSGSRAKVAEAAQEKENKKFYVGHILHPFFRDGIRSLAYEIAEQSAWNVPERIYLPVSAGTLLLGVISGFRHLMRSNVIKTFPRIVACQTRQVSPLYHHFKNLIYTPPKRIISIADALVSTDPPLLKLMTRDLKGANGDAVMVEENEILEAYSELAKRGFFVEPSSAVAYAAYKKQLFGGEVSHDNITIIVLTGMGLKTVPRQNW